mgnify:CR=1 FL=1
MRRKKRLPEAVIRHIFVIFAIFVMCGCNSHVSPASITEIDNNLSGTVTLYVCGDSISPPTQLGPVEGAVVTAYEGGIERGSAVADSDGNYLITGLPPGDYEIITFVPRYGEAAPVYVTQTSLFSGETEIVPKDGTGPVYVTLNSDSVCDIQIRKMWMRGELLVEFEENVDDAAAAVIAVYYGCHIIRKSQFLEGYLVGLPDDETPPSMEPVFRNDVNVRYAERNGIVCIAGQ